MKGSSAADTLESMSQAVWYNQWTLRKFSQYLRGDILEVGCGIGNFTNTLTRYGDVWAIDIDEKYITQTKLLADGKARVGFGDIEKGLYFFSSRRFNAIVCLNVLEHVKNDDLALNNLFKLLKKGGKLILLVPAHQFLYGEIDRSIGHFKRYDKYIFTKALERIGFRITLLRSINFLGAIGWFLAGKIFKENVVKETNIKIFNFIAPVILPLEDIFEPPIGTSILLIAQKP